MALEKQTTVLMLDQVDLTILVINNPGLLGELPVEVLVVQVVHRIITYQTNQPSSQELAVGAQPQLEQEEEGGVGLGLLHVIHEEDLVVVQEVDGAVQAMLDLAVMRVALQRPLR